MTNTIKQVKQFLAAQQEEIINGVVEAIYIHAGTTGKTALEVIEENKKTLVERTILNALSGTIGTINFTFVIKYITKQGKLNGKDTVASIAAATALAVAVSGIVTYYGKKAEQIIKEKEQQQA